MNLFLEYVLNHSDDSHAFSGDKRWKAEVCGGAARGLDSLGLFSHGSGVWQPLNPARSAKHSEVRLAISGQRRVLHHTDL